MIIGFSGRPSAPAGRLPTSTPADRVARYTAACLELGVSCLEAPATLVLGKGSWRNQYLTTCTESAHLRTSNSPSSSGIQILLRVRSEDGAEARMSDGALDKTGLAYARYLAHMLGVALVTVQFRPSRDPADGAALPAGDQGAAPVGLMVNWSDQGAVESAARVVRRSRGFMLTPIISLNMERPSRLAQAVSRVLAVCHRENGSSQLYLFVNGPHVDTQPGKMLPIEQRALLEAVQRFEDQSECEVSLILAGPGSEKHARRMAESVAAYRRVQAAAGGEGVPVSRIGSTVRIRDIELGLDMQYSIVPPEMASAKKGLLSCESPVARAIIGQPCGAMVEVSAPGGRVVYEVLEVIG